MCEKKCPKMNDFLSFWEESLLRNETHEKMLPWVVERSAENKELVSFFRLLNRMFSFSALLLPSLYFGTHTGTVLAKQRSNIFYWISAASKSYKILHTFDIKNSIKV